MRYCQYVSNKLNPNKLAALQRCRACVLAEFLPQVPPIATLGWSVTHVNQSKLGCSDPVVVDVDVRTQKSTPRRARSSPTNSINLILN